MFADGIAVIATSPQHQMEWVTGAVLNNSFCRRRWSRQRFYNER